MPIYEYACKKCGKVVEVFQKVSDPPPKSCEKCGGKLGRVISHTSFQLKGGGWYKDLYASAKPDSGSSDSDSGGSAKSDLATAASDAKPADKSEGKSDAKADAKSDSKPAKAEPKTESKAETKKGKEKKAGKAAG